MQKEKKDLDLIPTPYTKINLKWIMGLIVSCKTIKLSEKTWEKNLWNLGLGKKFFDLAPTAWSKKGKSDKFDFKIWNFCSVKDPIKQEKTTSYRPGENIYKPCI